MNIYLLRHGEAIEQGHDDAARPLSARGKEQSKLAAEALRTLGVTLAEIISSPYTRAQETAAIVQHELHVPKLTSSEFMVPGSDHRKLLEHLQELTPPSVLLVGHEPHLSTFVSILINGSTYSHISIKKGSLLYVESPEPLERGKCQLRWLFTQEEMKYLKTDSPRA